MPQARSAAISDDLKNAAGIGISCCATLVCDRAAQKQMQV